MGRNTFHEPPRDANPETPDERMSDDETGTISIPDKVRKRGLAGHIDVVEEEYTLDLYQVEELLEQALRGTLDGVDKSTIRTELEHRSR